MLPNSVQKNGAIRESFANTVKVLCGLSASICGSRADMRSSHVMSVDAALKANPKCEAGLLVQQRVFAVEKGPSGGPELLAVLFADDPSFHYWYGHVLLHPAQKNTFVSLIIQSTVLVNATSSMLQMARFHYWISGRLCYEPCTIQRADDAYAESENFDEAVAHLRRMIAAFDRDKRGGYEDTPYAIDACDLRILGVYGMTGCRLEDGSWPGPPMPSVLALVK